MYRNIQLNNVIFSDCYYILHSILLSSLYDTFFFKESSADEWKRGHWLRNFRTYIEMVKRNYILQTA